MSEENVDKKPFRVIIWAVPRSISTCVLKCLSYQPDTQAWFEPYCLAFFADITLKRFGITLPRHASDFDPQAFAAGMAAQVKGTPLEQMASKFSPDETDITLLIRDSVRVQLESAPADKSHIIKDMAYAATGFYDTLPSKESNYRHVFLIRDPSRMFPSWRRLLQNQVKFFGENRKANGDKITDENFDMTTDVNFMMPGFMYKCQVDLWNHVKENLDPNPVIIDCDELAVNPAEMLPKLCEATGMPFDKSLLEWDGNADCCDSWRCLHPMHKGDGKKTHHMALTSTSFQTPSPPVPQEEMTQDTIKCIDATMEYYKQMAACRIKPDA